MTDILGPASDNAVTSRPARTNVRGSSDTWFQDCTGADTDDGTAIPADYLNDILAQIRTALSSSGITRDNADDMLWRAMASIGVRYGEDTGSTNHIVVAFLPAPVLTLGAGNPRLLLIKLANDVTGAVDLTADATATKALKWPDGTALASGDAKAGAHLLVSYDGTNFQLLCRMNGGGAGATPAFVPGQIAMWASEALPTGTLECNGTAVSRSTYSRLFDIIGTAWGSGNGTTTFNLPDLRGREPRGWAHGSTNDPDRATRTASNAGGATGDHVGSVQGDQVGSFSASGSVNVPACLGDNSGVSLNGFYPGYDASVIGSLSGGTVSVSRTASETRSKNAAVMFVIAY